MERKSPPLAMLQMSSPPCVLPSSFELSASCCQTSSAVCCPHLHLQLTEDINGLYLKQRFQCTSGVPHNDVASNKLAFCKALQVHWKFTTSEGHSEGKWRCVATTGGLSEGRE